MTDMLMANPGLAATIVFVNCEKVLRENSYKIIEKIDDKNNNFPLLDENTFFFNYDQTDKVFFEQWLN